MSPIYQRIATAVRSNSISRAKLEQRMEEMPELIQQAIIELLGVDHDLVEVGDYDLTGKSESSAERFLARSGATFNIRVYFPTVSNEMFSPTFKINLNPRDGVIFVELGSDSIPVPFSPSFEMESFKKVAIRFENTLFEVVGKRFSA